MIIVTHDLWTTPTEIVVSAIGWIAVVEGVLLMAFRVAFLRMVRFIPFNAAVMIPYAVITIAFGIWLIYSAVA